ncbi:MULTISPECIES: flavocytochrome c [unclassified Clostridium]|uniref:flavocytochrome c n=1 Tax=unclassified Clostridium TaxID=2614128 RepID=UPI000ED0C9D5|nr:MULTISPECIES: flavocytochrome c [unclassified Clostridium]HCQ89923.1 flavocytochrome c [Clostridium sp.]
MKKKILALAMTAIITIPLLVGCGSKTESADIVIIGAGGAGLAAAVEAQESGAKIVVLEKMPMVGGNTTRATGGLNAAGTKAQEKTGIEDSAELFFKDTMKGGYNKNNEELVKVLTEEAKDTVEWLESLGADLSDVGAAGGASVRRIHRPTGGSAVGPNIISTLKKVSEDKKIDIRTMNEAVEIVKDKEGKISAVKATNKEGKEYTINTKSVILTAGGFSANKEMVVENKAELEGFDTTNHPGATGDGIVLAKKVGAAFVDMSEIQTHPTVVPGKGIMITEAVRGNGAILVNKDGKRFINELLTRDVVSKAILDQKDKVGYLFFDEELRKGLKSIEEYFSMDLVTEGNSIEELAEKLDIDKANLTTTVETYNKAQKSNNDTEFQRTDMAVSLESPKFYAIEVTPAVHHTMGGVKINTDGEVIGEDGQVIPGFYAAGEVTGGIHGGNRLGGNALADIIVYGRRAGQTAAKNLK